MSPTISANNDETIGKLIAEAMAKVNNEGVITVEEAKGRDQGNHQCGSKKSL